MGMETTLHTCIFCGESFARKRQPGRPPKFCPKHRSKANGGEGRPRPPRQQYVPVDHPPRPCGICGEDFLPSSTRARYCGNRCYNRAESLRKRREHQCEFCGASFWAEYRTATHSRGQRRFCSKSCSARARVPYGPPEPKVVRESPIHYEACLDCGGLIVRSGKRNRKRCRACVAARRRESSRNFRRKNYQPKTETAIVYRRCDECERFFVRQSHHRWCGECPACSKRRRKYERKPRSAANRRSFLLKRDKQMCQLCGTKTLPKWTYIKGTKVPHPKAPTVDHVVPVAQGGSHDDSNLQLAHFECNWRKADRPMGEQLRMAA